MFFLIYNSSFNFLQMVKHVRLLYNLPCFCLFQKNIFLLKMTGPTIRMTGLEQQQQQQQHSKLHFNHNNNSKKNPIKDISVLQLLCAIIQCYFAYIVLHIFNTFAYYFIRDFYFMILIAVFIICFYIMYHKLML